MTLIPLPAFNDNYIWMLRNGHDALVVDPGDPHPVLQALHAQGLCLRGILITHHHADHTAGVDALRAATAAPVYGPAHEPMPEPLTRVSNADSIRLLDLTFKVLDVPGHTAGHVAYFCPSVEGIMLCNRTSPITHAPLLFCGDTLFSAGCGRLLGGTAEQMLASLHKLSALPLSTLVCAAHEYTLNNLKFGLEVEPDNDAVKTYYLHCQNLRAQGLPTLPSTLEVESQVNPFLRTHTYSVAQSTREFDPAGVAHNGVFATLRHWKNIYV